MNNCYSFHPCAKYFKKPFVRSQITPPGHKYSTGVWCIHVHDAIRFGIFRSPAKYGSFLFKIIYPWCISLIVKYYHQNGYSCFRLHHVDFSENSQLGSARTHEDDYTVVFPNHTSKKRVNSYASGAPSLPN